MKFKYMLIASLILAILMAGTVSAEDTVSQDVITDNDNNGLEITQDEINTETETPKTIVDLYYDITNADDVLEIQCDYKFNNETDPNIGIPLIKENFVINGNGHTIDGNNQSRIFHIYANNITINNLTFINANYNRGSVFYINPDCLLTTNNVVLQNNTADEGVIWVYGKYVSNNDVFIDSATSKRGTIVIDEAEGVFNNALMMSSRQMKWGLIDADSDSCLYVYNSTFANTTSKYTTAIHANKRTVIKNSTFINLHADISAGAIGVKCDSLIDECIIDSCTFVNVTSEKNGGAILADVYNAQSRAPVTITNSRFSDCYSEFGGAIMEYGGNLTIDNCTFTDNSALFDGGAIYTSWTMVSVVNSTFDENKAKYNGTDRPTYGGTIFCDIGWLDFIASSLKNSDASTAAIYLYDSNYVIKNSIFENNCPLNESYSDICTAFDYASCILENNIYSGNDTLSLDNKIYELIIVASGMKLTLINNTISVTSLPSKFDLRDWGWVTHVKDQGAMGACWAFGTVGAIESAVLRYLGLEIDASENNMQDTSLQYYKYGTYGRSEGGNTYVGATYALSWLGVVASEHDLYDELGKTSTIIATNDSIHFQDVVFIPVRENVTDNNPLKEAIIKYGAVSIGYYAADPPFVNETTGAQYFNETLQPNHGVTLIGWDDTYSADNFIITPPGDGAWIIKNSWGENEGTDGYFYISYYDLSFATVRDSAAYVLENTIEYNKNYQLDLGGNLYFESPNKYANAFVAVADDLIAGIGTYFNATGDDYTIEVYVNDILKLNQSGIAPFRGFHTVKLDSYIPIKEGDVFAVEITTSATPILKNSRAYYPEGLSQFLMNGTWVNASDNEEVCSIKVYTVADDSQVTGNEDISVDYAGGKYFKVKITTADGHAVAGADVKFTINKNTFPVKTDDNGIAKVKITDVPKTYTIKTEYNAKTYTNKVTVKQVLKTSKVTVKKTAKKFSLKATLKINGKLVKGKTIKFKFNGKTYKVKTNAKGVAQKTLKKSVINKLKKGKTYTVKVTYLKDTIKSTVKVK